jgi:uncharacterized protein YbbC (DUF1343 family)
VVVNLSSPVLPALDRIHQNDVALQSLLVQCRQASLGLLTNHTGSTREGNSALEVLQAQNCRVQTLFSPEHGPQGTLEGNIESSRSEEGLPIYSLYGATRRPTAEMLDGLDIFVCDLQDVGARFYTYASTLAYAMEECATRGIKVLVLDRPNPLGDLVEGPLLEAEHRSFVGYFDIPICHGMTMGELALWHRKHAKLDLDLEIVEVANWQRTTKWPTTQLPWRVPSPNLPDYHAAAWYPGTCLLEFSKISVGRGTVAPFQIIGAPWLESHKVLDAIQKWPAELRTMYQAEAIEFVPTRATFEGETCRGLHFSTPENDNVPSQPVALGLALLATLHATHPQEFDDAQLQKSRLLLASSRVTNILQQGDIEAAWQIARNDAQEFRTQRQPFLLYS